MKRLVFALFAACLLCLPCAALAADADAEENTGLNYFTGEIGVDVTAGHTSGSDAKANEYGPRDGGMGLGVDLEWVKEKYQFRMDGYFNGGINDSDGREGFQQYDYDFNASFKKLDSYKIEAFAQRIIHNMSEGRTTGDPKSTQWTGRTGNPTDFTFYKARTNVGLNLEAAFGTPFFASVKLESKQTEGIAPLFTSGGISTYPLDYDVTMISGQFGYRSDNLIIKLDGSFDQLRNSEGLLSDDGSNSHYLKKPNPESDNYKIGASLSWRIPEISSTLMARASFANMTSDWMGTGSYYSADPDGTRNNDSRWDDYKADIKNTVVNVAFTSRPIKGLSTKVYVNYFDRDNDSEIEWRTPPPTAGSRAYNDLAFYEFERLTIGAQAAYRFAGDYKIAAGYEYEGVDRSAYDVTEVEKTDDNQIWAQFDAQLSDMFAVNLRYEFLNRDSSENEIAYEGRPTSWAIAPWFSYADTASKRQHKIKAGLEFTPVDKLYLGLEYAFTYDDFTKDQDFGLDDGHKHSVIADISYDFGRAQVAMYGGVEYNKSKTDQRAFADVADANPSAGNTALDTTNWDFEQEDITWSFGLNGNIALIEDKLDLQLRYDFVMNDGKTDLSSAYATGFNRGDINKVDDYTEHMLSAILKYQLDEHHSFGLGYTFSYLDYEDYAYDDSGSTHTSMTNSGYNHDSSYETHAVGLTYKYKF